MQSENSLGVQTIDLDAEFEEGAIGKVSDGVQDEEKTVTFLGRKCRGITGSTLKIIAIVTMLIDHIGAAVIEPYLQKMIVGNDYSAVYNSTWFLVDRVLRSIGRMGFPIFCFCLRAMGAL